MDKKKRSSRVQGGWAVTSSKLRSDRDKPKLPEAPCWMGKNVDIWPVNSIGIAMPMSSQSGETNKKFVYETPTETIQPKQQVKVISKTGVYELSVDTTGISRVRLFPNFLMNEEADEMYAELFNEVPWRPRSDMKNGMSYQQPRLTAWFGDVPYAYSGLKHEPNMQWPSRLWRLKCHLEELTGQQFNSALLNLYRNNHDHLPWHADDERSLRNQPVIASVSLGETRFFELRRKPLATTATEPEQKPDELVRIPLDNGTLLIMEGALQEQWQHRIPKEYHDRRPRINITLRMTYLED